MISPFPFGVDQTIDVPDKVPTSGLELHPSFTKSKNSISHFPLLSPNQIALQIILTELRTISFLFKEVMNTFVRTEFFPFPFENFAHSAILDFFDLSTTVSRSLKTAQRQAWLSPRLKADQRPDWISPRLNVYENKNTEWVSTYCALLRKQWWSQLSHFRCRELQTHTQWSRDRQGCCRDCPFSKANQSDCVRCWFQWETCGHTLWEGLIVQTVAQSITLLAEWQWMDSSEYNNGREVDEPSANARNNVEKCGDNCGSSKVRWSMDETQWLFWSSQELQILYHDWVSLIVSRFSVFIKKCVIRCCHVTESFCEKWRFARALPARSPRNLGSIADFAVSIFGEE